MELRIKASKTRSVSTRELSRRMADLIDEMEIEGLGLVILRYGRPAALLVPIEPAVRRAPRRVSIEKLETDPREEAVDVSVLDTDDRRLLIAMADRLPDDFSPDDWAGPIDRFCVASSRLELDGLSEQNGARISLTEKGVRAVAVLRQGEAAA